MDEITRISIEIPYSDNSGIEFAVRLDQRFKSDGCLSVIFQEGEIEVAFPPEKIEWLKSCLKRIEAELGAPNG
jgi:hypothetical protein